MNFTHRSARRSSKAGISKLGYLSRQWALVITPPQKNGNQLPADSHFRFSTFSIPTDPGRRTKVYTEIKEDSH